MKAKKKRSAENKTRFRPGTTGVCEAQLWSFTSPQGIFHDDKAAEVHWVAAESLEAALHYMRRRQSRNPCSDNLASACPNISSSIANVVQTRP
jgi:hypothetical protein